MNADEAQDPFGRLLTVELFFAHPPGSKDRVEDILPVMCVAAHGYVLDRSHVLKQPDVLKRAADASLGDLVRLALSRS